MLQFFVLPSSSLVVPYNMKLCLAQIASVKGDISINIAKHRRATDLAVSHGADIIIFPELSLTGYHPSLARRLSTFSGDERFEEFQRKSDLHGITLAMGAPITRNGSVCIGMLLFQPTMQRTVYIKKYLHADEEQFFSSGIEFTGLIANNTAALAICYEISVPEHAANAFAQGARFYLASVAKSAQGAKNAITALARIAQTYNMTVLMANAVGESEGFVAGGQSSIWNSKGMLLGQLSGVAEGLLMLDMDTEQMTKVEW